MRHCTEYLTLSIDGVSCELEADVSYEYEKSDNSMRDNYGRLLEPSYPERLRIVSVAFDPALPQSILDALAAKVLKEQGVMA